jgi:FlaA1/EpsC-like NDP-sugar epimerase
MAVILPVYLAMFAFCYATAFLLRFEFDLEPDVVELMLSTAAVFIGVKLAMCFLTGEWRRSYRYPSLHDMLFAAASATGAAAVLYAANHFRLFGPIPRSVIVIDWALTIPCSGLIRTGARIYTEILFAKRPRNSSRTARRALVVGTDRDAVEILRKTQLTESGFLVVGMVETGPYRGRTLIGGVPTYPVSVGWGKLAAKLSAEMVLIPSSVPGDDVREIVRESREHGFKTHVIPSVEQIVGGRFKLDVRDVTISDLLRREPARLDMHRIRGFVENHRVLVTGAAGSIGSELCRQLLRLKPAELVLLDQSELGMFHMTQELDGVVDPLRAGGPAHPSGTGPETAVRFVMADVTDEETLRRTMQEHRPQTIFHAAAYKHVPLMEDNVREAVRNNVFGTKTVVDCAAECGAQRFVLISTDKAVRPSSVMGATKFVAEKYVQTVAAGSRMRCITVRFGNVLNSAGSVVPTFRRQIKAGGPVTVTHPDMERYFMTIPEAVQLVLQAAAVGESGDLLVLEMGKPCKIVDLARDMIQLSGLKYPDDIDIAFTGLRPGEKLTEELFYETEACSRKVHEKIYSAARETPSAAVLARQLGELRDACTESEVTCRAALTAIVEHHTASGTTAAPLRKAA